MYARWVVGLEYRGRNEIKCVIENASCCSERESNRKKEKEKNEVNANKLSIKSKRTKNSEQKGKKPGTREPSK